MLIINFFFYKYVICFYLKAKEICCPTEIKMVLDFSDLGLLPQISSRILEGSQ